VVAVENVRASNAPTKERTLEVRLHSCFGELVANAPEGADPGSPHRSTAGDSRIHFGLRTQILTMEYGKHSTRESSLHDVGLGAQRSSVEASASF